MWVDAETKIDYLNFGSVADSVVELIEQAGGTPLSIGVSGAWGVGKSSLVKQTRDALERRDRESAAAEGVSGKDYKSRYVFVEFNAWLYQGYDDARAALLDAIASELVSVADQRQTAGDKAREFLSRVDWFRVASLTAGSAAAMAFGLPPVGLLGQLFTMAKRLGKGDVDAEFIKDGETAIGQAADQAKGLVKDNDDPLNPRQQIAALRKSFEEALAELGVTLVVLIDDLDRCLPETAVSTLEAIRLFLFLEGTAFVIAADDKMIKHAVRKHFDDPDDDLVTNYFDKLIQIPIRVPTLGTQEVRAYMFLLYVEGSSLDAPEKETIRSAVCNQLQESWRGKRVDRQFVAGLEVELQPELVAQLDTAERLTKLMTSSSIAGNPRLIKRFLNTLSVRMGVAARQGIAVDEQVLAKLLLFERLAPKKLYDELAAAINNSPDGKPTFLAAMEPQQDAPQDQEKPTETAKPDEPHGGSASVSTANPKSGKPKAAPVDAAAAAQPQNRPGWDEDFAKEWLALAPPISDVDMRGAMYVSREHLPVITDDASLSAEAAEILEALLSQPGQAASLRDQISGLSAPDRQRVFDNLLEVARRVDEWGAPPILVALIEVSTNAQNLEAQLAAFIGSRPHGQIKPAIVPRVAGTSWGGGVLATWTATSEIALSVKAAIASAKET
jgi:predicted KAP-like P-loop ATPase